jgi:hypothetical protein
MNKQALLGTATWYGCTEGSSISFNGADEVYRQKDATVEQLLRVLPLGQYVPDYYEWQEWSREGRRIVLKPVKKMMVKKAMNHGPRLLGN